MPTVNEAERSPDAEQISPTREDISSRPGQRKLRVYMMDLWSFIPYYMAGLCSALATQDVDATLGSARYHLDRNYFRKAGLVPDRLLIDAGGSIKRSAVRRLLKSCEYIANLFVLSLRLPASRPDILHVQYLPFLERGFRFELWFLRWVRRFGIRVVYTVHNATRQDAPGQGRPIFRRAYQLADALICHGEAARTELERDFQIAADKIWVIPHGPLFHDGPQLSPQDARSKLGLRQEEPLVLCLGVISEYKGIPFLLDAWKKLKAAGSEGRLLIAGTGDQRILTEIREKTVAEGLSDSVSLWLQFIPVEQLPLLHQAADILVYPYKAGTTSGALLTGLNYGRAVVATKLPFFLEHLQDGETALLVDYGATDALAAALQSLVQQPLQRSKLAKALQCQASQGNGWQEIARKTKQCYQTTLAMMRGSRGA
jgi:glycosyltransferase involved in cell wall biosynthesis